MNFGSILADLYRRFDYTGNPVAPVVTARLTQYINDAHRELCSLPGMQRLRDDVMSITAYNGIARTGLPPVVARIHAITDRTNNHSLEQVPLKLLRVTDPAQAFVGGYPLRYSVIGNQAAYRQPGGSTPAASGLWVASAAAGDTTQRVFVRTVVTGGVMQPQLVGGTTLNGVTRVQIGSLTTHIEITKFYLDNPCTGAVSLYDAASGGNELAVIPIGQTASRYLAVEWFPIQQQDITEYVDYEREISDLSDPSDEPLLPPDFHQLVSLGARLREYESIDDSRLSEARSQYEQGKAALKDFVMNDGDRLASLRRTPIRWSRLGAMYPAQGYW